jgi:hypothetical protein
MGVAFLLGFFFLKARVFFFDHKSFDVHQPWVSDYVSYNYMLQTIEQNCYNQIITQRRSPYLVLCWVNTRVIAFFWLVAGVSFFMENHWEYVGIHVGNLFHKIE